MDGSCHNSRLITCAVQLGCGQGFEGTRETMFFLTMNATARVSTRNMATLGEELDYFTSWHNRGAFNIICAVHER